jgi:hypothetical protein
VDVPGGNRGSVVAAYAHLTAGLAGSHSGLETSPLVNTSSLGNQSHFVHTLVHPSFICSPNLDAGLLT